MKNMRLNNIFGPNSKNAQKDTQFPFDQKKHICPFVLGRSSRPASEEARQEGCPEDVAKHILGRPQVHCMKDVHHDKFHPEPRRRKQWGHCHTRILQCFEELGSCVASLSPQSFWGEVAKPQVRFICCTPPANPMRSPTLKPEELFVPRPIPPDLDNDRSEAELFPPMVATFV